MNRKMLSRYYPLANFLLQDTNPLEIHTFGNMSYDKYDSVEYGQLVKNQHLNFINDQIHGKVIVNDYPTKTSVDSEWERGKLVYHKKLVNDEIIEQYHENIWSSRVTLLKLRLRWTIPTKRMIKFYHRKKIMTVRMIIIFNNGYIQTVQIDNKIVYSDGICYDSSFEKLFKWEKKIRFTQMVNDNWSIKLS